MCSTTFQTISAFALVVAMDHAVAQTHDLTELRELLGQRRSRDAARLSASPMMPRRRSTASRTMSSRSYAARSSPAVYREIARQERSASRSRRRVSVVIDGLTGGLDGPAEVGVTNRAIDDDIDRAAKERL